MSYGSRLDPYMDPYVFRSSTHSHRHAGQGLTDPRYTTSGYLRHDNHIGESSGRYYDGFKGRHSYRSGERYTDHHESSSRAADSFVRKTNQMADVANSTIDRVSHNTLIQPKICMVGRFPSGFAMPLTLIDIMGMREGQLDRLLEDYEIPIRDTGGLGSRSHSLNLRSPDESKVLKISALLDFLGARQVADVLRSGSGRVSTGFTRQSMGSRR